MSEKERITAGDILDILTRSSDITSEERALEIITTATGQVFNIYFFLADTNYNEAQSGVLSLDTAKRQLQMIDSACEGRFIAALGQLKGWLKLYDRQNVLSSGDCYHLSVLYLLCLSYHKRRWKELLSADPASEIRTNPRYVKSVKDLGLSRRAEHVVLRAGCETTEDIAKIGRKNLQAARGCGKSSIEDIARRMRACGYEW